MISMVKYWSPFKVDESSNITTSVESKPVGLKILTTQNHHDSKLIFQRNQIPSSYNNNHPCFLKSCFLCHKHLSPNKDIYMYRGNEGFCSEECRSRQIYIDDVTQLEISTKKMIQQYNQSRRCNASPQRHRQKSTASPIFS